VGGWGEGDISEYNGNQSAGKSQRCALKLMLNFKFVLVVFCDSVIKTEWTKGGERHSLIVCSSVPNVITVSVCIVI